MLSYRSRRSLFVWRVMTSLTLRLPQTTTIVLRLCQQSQQCSQRRLFSAFPVLSQASSPTSVSGKCDRDGDNSPPCSIRGLSAPSATSSSAALDFTNTERAYKFKTTKELLRGYLVYNLFSFGFLVDRSKQVGMVEIFQRLY